MPWWLGRGARHARYWDRPGWRSAMRQFAMALVAGCLLFGLLPAAADEPPNYAAQLAALAAKCDGLGLAREAQLTREWVIPRPPGREVLFVPAESDATVPRAGAPDLARKWHENFRQLR